MLVSIMLGHLEAISMRASPHLNRPLRRVSIAALRANPGSYFRSARPPTA